METALLLIVFGLICLLVAHLFVRVPRDRDPLMEQRRGAWFKDE